jgi:hypothetical protein
LAIFYFFLPFRADLYFPVNFLPAFHYPFSIKILLFLHFGLLEHPDLSLPSKRAFEIPEKSAQKRKNYYNDCLFFVDFWQFLFFHFPGKLCFCDGFCRGIGIFIILGR